MEVRRVSTGTPWESRVGYSRAVRVGDHVFVAGTTASDAHGETVAVGDPYGQARFVIEKIAGALAEAGAALADVVRTRMYVVDMDHQDEVGRAHAEAFAEIRPAATMVEVTRLANPDHLVEIEMEALVRPASH